MSFRNQSIKSLVTNNSRIGQQFHPKNAFVSLFHHHT